MRDILATMITITTYGTWLRGDRRGWVDEGKTLPPDPDLEAGDRRRSKYSPYVFGRSALYRVGNFMGASLIDRLQLDVLALHVGTWHSHIVVGATDHSMADVVKCAKDAVRYGLRPGRPIWSDGYDKRYCFDDAAVVARIRYVERHNEALGWTPAPWTFIKELRFGDI